MHHLVKYRYVHRDVDRHGNTRIYFRRAMGQPKFRLPGEPGSPEFNARYEALLRGEADLKPSVAASEPQPAPHWFGALSVLRRGLVNAAVAKRNGRQHASLRAPAQCRCPR